MTWWLPTSKLKGRKRESSRMKVLREISLISHARKIMLKILQVRIQ